MISLPIYNESRKTSNKLKKAVKKKLAAQKKTTRKENKKGKKTRRVPSYSSIISTAASSSQHTRAEAGERAQRQESKARRATVKFETVGLNKNEFLDTPTVAKIYSD